MSDATLPSRRYADGVARGDWQHDPAQQPALLALDRIHAALQVPVPTRGVFQRLFGNAPPPAPQGLYLWGGVGRGKTFLIDLFFAGLPFPEKRRTHFHRFMRDVHQRLRDHAGERDPLVAIAREWRRSVRVLVLDEFFVSDIGDAMLLGRLLDRMFAEGIVLVTSSNAAPTDLYKDGLQRARFLPAIALIEQHCNVVELVSDTDYRLRALTRSPVYRTPLDAGSDTWLQQRWRELGGDDGHVDAGIVIDGRRIPVRARSKGLCWFDFAALCEGPRGNADYIEVAREFHTVLIAGIPRMDASRDDAARRFVHLVDELYDRHVNLVCTAEAAPMDLYAGERLIAAFERTASRLVEMQSTAYLAHEHGT
ncbi:cell division protein ZapE [Thermomonas carbonis]|uniref:Cell division protein ZapE n=1 Tax=Thermomonas carbonis TaxID=1463158 RepID=A0A7G9SSX2_9GAMM|nr:cell division protein ZapE [Thermomonas carbonis]QNN70947.1 cell division protein ZapE [Thermomonas carbonis]GHC03550.1 cell division protein ZapE [Thermomonas carbonis]